MTRANRILHAALAALLLAACATAPTPEYSCLQDRTKLSSPPLDVRDASDIAALSDENSLLVLMKVTVLGAGEHAGRLGEAPSGFGVGFGDFASAVELTGVHVALAPAGPTAASGWAKFYAYPGTVFATPQPGYFFSRTPMLRIDPPVRARIVYAGEMVVCSLTPKRKSSGFLGGKSADNPVVSYRPSEHRIEDIIMEPQPVIDALKARYPGASIIAVAAVRHEGRVVVRTFDD